MAVLARALEMGTTHQIPKDTKRVGDLHIICVYNMCLKNNIYIYTYLYVYVYVYKILKIPSHERLFARTMGPKACGHQSESNPRTIGCGLGKVSCGHPRHVQS